jgi:hypothetical protein
MKKRICIDLVNDDESGFQPRLLLSSHRFPRYFNIYVNIYVWHRTLLIVSIRDDHVIRDSCVRWRVDRKTGGTGLLEPQSAVRSAGAPPLLRMTKLQEN